MPQNAASLADSCAEYGFTGPLRKRGPPFLQRVPNATRDRVVAGAPARSSRAGGAQPLQNGIALRPFQPDRPAEPNAVNCLREGP